MDLLIHCQVYWPDNSAVSQMISGVAEDAAKAGCSVTVVTSLRGYNLDALYLPFEVHEGVSIHRVRGSNLNRHKTFGRIGNYFSFTFYSMIKLLRMPRPDVLVITSVPPLSLLLGTALWFFKKVPFIYVVEDLYPEIAFQAGILNERAVSGKALSRAFAALMRQAKAIIVLGEYMKARLVKSHPCISEDIVYPIHNWHDGTSLYPMEREESAAVLFQYSGNLGEAHEFDTLIKAAKFLRNNSHIRFEFVGRGKRFSLVENMIRKENLQNCQLRDYVPAELLNTSLNQADVCLVALAKGYEGLIVPSKIYGIMAVGKPVLFIGGLTGEVPDLIRKYQLGWLVEEGDVNSLVNTLLEAARSPETRSRYGRNARLAFEKFFDRPIGTSQYIEVFKSVCRGGARTA